MRQGFWRLWPPALLLATRPQRAPLPRSISGQARQALKAEAVFARRRPPTHTKNLNVEKTRMTDSEDSDGLFVRRRSSKTSERARGYAKKRSKQKHKLRLGPPRAPAPNTEDGPELEAATPDQSAARARKFLDAAVADDVKRAKRSTDARDVAPPRKEKKKRRSS